MRITQNQIAKVEVNPTSTIYTGKRIEPDIVVTGSLGMTLVEGRDYTVTLFREVTTLEEGAQKTSLVGTGLILNADKYIIRVSGKGNYGGEHIDTEFIVEPKDISDPLVDQEDNHIPVNISVPEYNLGTTRTKAVLTYNGLVMSPAADYVQQFRANGETTTEEGLYPDEIVFTGMGNYKGSRIVTIKDVELPEGDLNITDSNNGYIYQADDLFGYLSLIHI